MKLLIKRLLIIPLLCLGGCYTQMAYRDAYDYQNQNNYNDTSTQTNNTENNEFLSPVCNVVEEPVVDLSGVGVTYNTYYQGNVQTKTTVKSGNGSNSGSSTDTRNRVNSNQSNSSTNNGSKNTNPTTQPSRTRDSGQSSPPNRERSRN
jgi:hypothetical protein